MEPIQAAIEAIEDAFACMVDLNNELLERWVVQHDGAQPGFVTRRIGGETIVVPLAGGIGDLDVIYTFNEVGSRIWSLLEKPTSVKAILTILCAEYDGSPEQIMTDLVELLETLRTRGLVRIMDAPAA